MKKGIPTMRRSQFNKDTRAARDEKKTTDFGVITIFCLTYIGPTPKIGPKLDTNTFILLFYDIYGGPTPKGV